MYRIRRKLSASVLTSMLILCAAPLAAAPIEGVPAPEIAKETGYLGIAGLECRCTLTVEPEHGRRMWHFLAEPVIRSIDENGPSAGKLESGDVIVAIDDMLITTRKAGRRFANLTPGETVQLTVRRGEQVMTLSLVPTETPEDDAKAEYKLVVPAPAPDVDLAKLAESLEALSVEMEVPAVPEVDRVAPVPQVQPVPAVPFFDIRPQGWFGLGIECSGCIIQRKPDSPAEWHFESPPTVQLVEPDSPAGRAGLEPGDVLTHIDGAPLDSEEGGERFSSVKPGETVTWTIRRDGDEKTVEMEALPRPDRLAPGARVPSVSPQDSRRTTRFKGAIGDTDVEVNGTRSVVVTRDEESGAIIIETRDATIRLRAREKD